MMKEIYVVTGGTLVHISPHFSLCAPAYGTVGQNIYNQLSMTITDQNLQGQYRVHLIKTKMAGQNSSETNTHLKTLGFAGALETNHDLLAFIEIILARPETIGLVMAAAICDFEPVDLTVTTNSSTFTLTEFGKDQQRLHHVQALALNMRPADKIIDSVKKTRPDIFLVTFKTTAGLPVDELFSQALYNLQRSKSDLVFANDIQTRQNLVVTPTGDRLKGENRHATLNMLCQEMIGKISL